MKQMLVNLSFPSRAKYLTLVFFIILTSSGLIKPQVTFANNDESDEASEVSSDATEEIEDSANTPIPEVPNLEPAAPDDYESKYPISRQFVRVSEKKDDLEKILRRYKFSKKEAARLKTSDALPEDYLVQPLTGYRVRLYSKPDHVDVTIYDPDQESAYVFRKMGPEVQVKRVASDLETENATLSGVVQKRNLVASVSRSVRDDRVAQKFMSAFIFDFAPEQISQDGSQFNLIVEKQYYKGQFVRFGEIIYGQLEINGTMEERHFVRFPRGGSYVNLSDDHSNRPLYLPIENLRVSSPFNLVRFHPRKRRILWHRGVDLAAPKGEPILAAADGIVDQIGRSRGGGRFIRLAHSNDMQTNYEHMSAYEPTLHRGDKVIAGQRIGWVGCTGYCTASHLHFGVKIASEFVDPVYYTRSYPKNQVPLVRSFFENRTGRKSAIDLIDEKTPSKK